MYTPCCRMQSQRPGLHRAHALAMVNAPCTSQVLHHAHAHAHANAHAHVHHVQATSSPGRSVLPDYLHALPAPLSRLRRRPHICTNSSTSMPTLTTISMPMCPRPYPCPVERHIGARGSVLDLPCHHLIHPTLPLRQPDLPSLRIPHRFSTHDLAHDLAAFASEGSLLAHSHRYSGGDL